jgi:hypothetical protein
MSNIPVAGRRYRHNPPLPSWRQSPMGKLRGTYPFSLQPVRAPFCCCRLVGCLAFKAQFAPQASTPDPRPKTPTAIVGFSHSFPSPSVSLQVRAAHRLAPHRLRWQSLPDIPSLEHLIRP